MKKGLLEKNLALERTLMSSERTMLSQVRTGFASILLGVALVKFFDDSLAIFLGWFFNFLGGATILIAVLLLPLRNKKIKNNYE